MRTFLWLMLASVLLPGSGAAVDHAAWDALLKAHVSEGRVDYAALGAQRPRLDAYLASLADVDPERLTRADQIAFWINAYNAKMVALVVDHFPIRGTDPSHPPDSVLQVPGIFQGPKSKLGGRELSLDQIEHEILRPRFQEPRIHAAIVCASLSCPELRAEAYDGARLEEQLETQFERFVTDPRRNRFDLASGTAELSQIFRWFAQDFSAAAEAGPALRRAAGEQAGILAFVAGFLPAPEREAALSGRLRVGFLPYDWALNGMPPAPTGDR